VVESAMVTGLVMESDVEVVQGKTVSMESGEVRG
jgi:hypothetical protein